MATLLVNLASHGVPWRRTGLLVHRKQLDDSLDRVRNILYSVHILFRHWPSIPFTLAVVDKADTGVYFRVALTNSITHGIHIITLKRSALLRLAAAVSRIILESIAL